MMLKGHVNVSDRSQSSVGFSPRFPRIHASAWAKAHPTTTFVGDVHVRNGAIVLDEPVLRPEGVEVEIHWEDFAKLQLPVVSPLMKYAGQAQGLGRDASRSIDQVLYGTREVP